MYTLSLFDGRISMRNRSFGEMIQKGGFDEVDDNLVDSAPVTFEDFVDMEVAIFFFHQKTHEPRLFIERADSRNPWIPARVEHLLTFSAVFPAEQKDCLIVGVGSMSNHRVPVLGGSISGRHVRLARVGRMWWYDVCGFLAVRPSTV